MPASPAKEARFQPLAWIPGFFLIHNLEEALTIPGHLDSMRQALSYLAPALPLPFPDYGQFLAPLILLTIQPFVFLWLYRRKQTAEIGQYLLLLTQTCIFLNVFSHIASAILLQGYSPGLVTALAINLPFSLLLANSAWRENQLRIRELPGLFLLAFLLHGPGLVGLIWLSTRIFPT